jgi:hypothetical protein
MDNLSQTDKDVRLQLLIDDVSKFGELISRQLMYGMKEAKANLKQLELAMVYMEILQDYNVIGSVINGNTIVDGDNCITEEEAQDMFQKLSVIFCRCFPAIGATYTDYVLGDFSDDFNNDFFI